MSSQRRKVTGLRRDPDLAGAQAAMQRAARRARRRAMASATGMSALTNDETVQPSLSQSLAEKSVQAVIAAMELYDKPDLSYREESFAVLMENAWELLLKAKWVRDHQDDERSLHKLVDDDSGTPVPEVSRSGNPVTRDASYLAERLFQDERSELERDCRDSVLALVEIGSNAAHFLHKDAYLSRRILEVGTASLHNHLRLAEAWFDIDVSRYNFLLMPTSSFRGSEVMEPASTTHYTEQTRKLLGYLNSLEQQEAGDCSQ